VKSRKYKDHNFLEKIILWSSYYLAILNDKIATFSLLRPPRPDFYNLDIELINVIEGPINENNDYYKLAIFPQVSPQVAKKYHWIETYEEYELLATLLFCHKYPQHPYSLSRRKYKIAKKYSPQQIRAIAKGEIKINIVK
jgi:hypothetical protein